MLKQVPLLLLALILMYPSFSQTKESQHQTKTKVNLNKPKREAWFTDLGFGMFIHWSFDVQLGMVISHSVVGASKDYQDRYFNELPKTFNPREFRPEEWARTAKMAGMKYMVFTTKHHSGFCMYDTETTDFKITNTPFARDATKEIVAAFRKEGIAVGVYFSPDDFWFMYDKGRMIERKNEEAIPSNNPDLMDYLKVQMRELMTNYGPIDIVFIDGIDTKANEALARICWEVNDDVVVTRGAIETPEQFIPDQAIPSPWEACFTMGDQWQYRPTNENYKSTRDLILKILEIRCKGGNLLLNVGPDTKGRIPEEQEAYLNELALWYFINKEAFDRVEPWHVIREGDVWFLKKRDADDLYAFITGDPIPYGKTSALLLTSVQATKDTKVSVLGHDNKTLEYKPEVDASSKFRQTSDGLELTVFRGQRIYNDKKWPNPIVVKLENIQRSNQNP